VNAARVQRLAHRLHVARIPLLPAALQYLMFVLYNSYIPFTARIGTGTVFAYGGIGVVIHADAEIGEGCVIGQGITIGAGEAFTSSQPNRCPRIGNNVYISAGARIIGGIRIGNDVVIGAGAVVTHDVADGSIVAGVPARVIGRVEPGYRAIRP
jgi:serine O-acetyltransferase